MSPLLIASNVNLVSVAVIGTLFYLPIMGAISWKSSLSTFIIALFVLAGVRVAGLISAKLFWSTF